MSQPTVLVVGASGAQGGSVARHLLHQRRFKVRALTRDPNSRRARAMRQAGVEVVYGDLDEIDSLRTALIDCQAVFGVTDYWEHYELEYTQGRQLIEAIITSRVRHIILSTQPPTSTISHRTLAVPQYDLKAHLEAYVRETALPASFVHIAFYYDNFLHQFLPQQQADGNYCISLPQDDIPLAAVATADIGGVIAAMFADPETFIGQTVGIVGDDRPIAEYAQIMSQMSELPIHYQPMHYTEFAQLTLPGAQDWAAQFEFNRRYVLERKNDLLRCQQLYPALRSFATWLQPQAAKLRAQLVQ